MVRKNQNIQNIQDSPFLNLPAEIRELIYFAALVRSTPIDLWPMKYENRDEDEESRCVFRLQEDLELVRKEMATGLFTTCKQISHQASSIFWSKNTFRFSGDIYWFGVRRFLGTIGPRALSQLQSLELFAPLVDLNCLDISLLTGGHWTWRHEIYKNALNAKNKPKMHMAKARSEPWNRNPSHSGRWRNKRDGRKSKPMLSCNVGHVCYLLDTAKTSLNLKFVLPAGFGLTLPPRPQQSSMYWGTPDRWPQNLDLKLSEELLRILPLFTRSATLVLEAGAKLMSLEMVEQFTNKGINVLCRAGTIFNYDPTQTSTAIKEAKLWTSHLTELDYLNGFPALFDEEHGIAVPALVGRATSTPGPKRLARVLKGFGGCRFIDQDEWGCSGCRWKGGIWNGKSVTSRTGYYIHTPANTKCSVRKHLVMKKKGRAARNGV